MLSLLHSIVNTPRRQVSWPSSLGWVKQRRLSESVTVAQGHEARTEQNQGSSQGSPTPKPMPGAGCR